MGEIADAMINGELCQWCGIYLEPNETVYMQKADGGFIKTKMPSDGLEFGTPVICKSCRCSVFEP